MEWTPTTLAAFDSELGNILAQMTEASSPDEAVEKIAAAAQGRVASGVSTLQARMNQDWREGRPDFSSPVQGHFIEKQAFCEMVKKAFHLYPKSCYDDKDAKKWLDQFSGTPHYAEAQKIYSTYLAHKQTRAKERVDRALFDAKVAALESKLKPGTSSGSSLSEGKACSPDS